MESLESLRKEMFLPTDGTILLNAGTMSPTPRAVMDAAAIIRQEQASNPHRFFFERHGEYITRARASLAKYLRVEKTDVKQTGSFGIGKGGFDGPAALFWLFVGVPLAWGVWNTFEKALVLFR